MIQNELDTIQAMGQLTIEKFNGVTGQTETTVVPNMIVTLGKQYIAGRMLQTPQSAMIAMAIGTGTTASTLADSQLATEILATAYTGGLIRPLLDAANNPSRAAAVLTYRCTFGTSATTSSNAITEAGIFDNTTRAAGVMMARTVFGVVTKTNLDTITITWTITIN
jgi:hypothetical protein